MAVEHEIDRAFRDLGQLFAAEHAEHDDEGARQVGQLIRLLRKFKAHEQSERRDPLAGALSHGLLEAARRPPGFRQTDSKTENCGTCRFMGEHGICTKYDWPVKPSNVCNSWQAARAREATYDLPDGRKVWYDAGDALQDAADLYAVLNEEHSTGSPNLENMQAREILGQLQRGGGLGEVHIGTLRGLLTKHQARIASYRRARDRQGQDMLAVASPASDSRIIHPTERT